MKNHPLWGEPKVERAATATLLLFYASLDDSCQVASEAERFLTRDAWQPTVVRQASTDEQDEHTLLDVDRKRYTRRGSCGSR